MKKRLLIAFIATLMVNQVAKAEFGFDTPDDYTGEAFFAPPAIEQPKIFGAPAQTSESKHTLPPIKKLRLHLKEKSLEKQQSQLELAPTAPESYVGEIETSKFASQQQEEDYANEIEEDLIKDMEQESILADSDKKSKKKIKEKKKDKKTAKKDKNISKKENKKKDNAVASENIILDCQKVDYDTENYRILATGNVSVKFVKQNTTVKADVITFDRINNTVKAEGNVRILKSGRVVTGDYIFVDLNEENALIENPITQTASIEIKSEKGFVYGDKIVQEKGNMFINDSFPIDFHSGNRGPKMRTMMIPKDKTLTDDMNSGLITFNAKEIKVVQKDDRDILTLKKPRLYKGNKLVFKTPSVKFYTNKNHDYVETNHWEIGSIRGLGLFAGPGFVAELPKGSVFKIIPMLNYKSGFGAGAVGRFSSGTNHTMLAYGTAMEKFLAYGKQDLDDNLYIQYATNSYMPEWFLGRRRPKYGVSLVYEKSYGAKGFLIPGQRSNFKHRIEGGYYHDLDFDNNFEKLRGSHIGTTRFRYMAEARQNLYQYKNEEELKALTFSVVSQLSSAVYGTGDTQVIGRVGPMLHLQYKRWMQDIMYYFAAIDDNTPMRAFDAYRYGQQSLYLRETFRVCRWLALSWFGMMNLSNDAPNRKDLQENGFYVSVGPDDLKFNLGYDFVRETLRCTVEVMMDAKGTKVEYDKFEITQKENTKKAQKKKPVPKKQSPNLAPVQQRVLERAIVESAKEEKNVL